MSSETFTLEELAQHLGRDAREIDRLASRGRIPGRKGETGWVFYEREITQWLERELREFTDPELRALEQSLLPSTAMVEADVRLRDLIRLETVQVPLDARTKRSALEGLIEVAGRSFEVWEPAKILSAVQEREETFSTAFRGGVAVPHPRNPLPQCLGDSIIAFGHVRRGVPFSAPDGSLTDLFFLVLCRDSRTHLRALARISRILQSPGFVENLRMANDSFAAYNTICELDEKLDGEGV